MKKSGGFPELPTGEGLIVWKQPHWLTGEQIFAARYSDSPIFTGDSSLAAARRALAHAAGSDPAEPDMPAEKWNILIPDAPLSRVKEGQICFIRVRVDAGVRDPWSKEPGVIVTPVGRNTLPSGTTQHIVKESDLISMADAIRAVRGGT